ncbi:derlin-1 [Eupeodes corollae]|uniref:derlin-1 n=1 Tax=Eupeodes corollae TaxID=290404 RepID=UPI0024905B5C|nr:derlin-1 [Eupeodes corollae]
MADIGTWYKNVPRFTKIWLSATVGISVLARFGILPPELLILDWNPIYKKFQIWRFITALFYYPLSPNTGFHFMLNCYFLYNYSLRLETDHFKTSPADYLFLLIFQWICCAISGVIFNLYILMDPMVLAVLYVWCQLNKEAIVNFWFGTRFKAMYLPWVLLGVNLILSSGGFDSLLGILIGHLYFFLKFQYPQELGGPSFLETPGILKSYFPDVSGGVHGFGIPPVNQRTAERNPPAAGNRLFGNAWGRGNPLGRN